MQRRAEPRVPSESTIELVVGEVVAARGSLRNVSTRGLGVARLEPVGDRTFAKGEHVVVRFDLPTGSIVADANIQWVNVGQRELGLKMTPDTANAAKLSLFLGLQSLSGGAPS